MTRKQVYLYLLIGTLQNLFFFFSFYFFTTILNFDPTIFVILSYPFFLFIPFYLNGKFTFKGVTNIENYLKYCTSFIALFLLNILTLEFFYRHLEINHNLVQIIFIILTTIVSFFITKFIFNN